MLLLVTSKRDILRMHHEMALPGASPNIGKVIYYNVDVRNKEITLAGNRIQLTLKILGGLESFLPISSQCCQ